MAIASDTRSRFKNRSIASSVAIDQVFAPFEAWLIENHPDDVPRLFDEVDGAGFTVTDQSVPLWGQRTREYVTEVTGP